MANFISYLKNKKKEEDSINIGLTSNFARAPYGGLYPKDYQIPEKLFAFRKELDQHIKELCEKGAVDAGNDKALDNFIASGISSCSEEINNQRAEHQKIIINLVNRRNGDLIDGQLKIEDYQKELDAVEMELAKLTNTTNAMDTEKNTLQLG
jgi:hypothetical protein